MRSCYERVAKIRTVGAVVGAVGLRKWDSTIVTVGGAGLDGSGHREEIEELGVGG